MIKLLSIAANLAFGAALALSLSSCSNQQGQADAPYGFNTIDKSQLLSVYGTPDSTLTGVTDPVTGETYDVLQYKDGQRFLLKGNQVYQKERPPTNLEKTLNYWFHILRGNNYELKEDPRVTGGTQKILECKEVGVTVTYTAATNAVVKIAEYAKP